MWDLVGKEAKYLERMAFQKISRTNGFPNGDINPPYPASFYIQRFDQRPRFLGDIWGSGASAGGGDISRHFGDIWRHLVQVHPQEVAMTSGTNASSTKGSPDSGWLPSYRMWRGRRSLGEQQACGSFGEWPLCSNF